jgi:hypothetical protein
LASGSETVVSPDYSARGPPGLPDGRSKITAERKRPMRAYPLPISAMVIDQFGNVITGIGIHDQWGSMAACTQSGPLDSPVEQQQATLSGRRRRSALRQTTKPLLSSRKSASKRRRGQAVATETAVKRTSECPMAQLLTSASGPESRHHLSGDVQGCCHRGFDRLSLHDRPVAGRLLVEVEQVVRLHHVEKA